MQLRYMQYMCFLFPVYAVRQTCACTVEGGTALQRWICIFSGFSNLLIYSIQFKALFHTQIHVIHISVHISYIMH